jgi:hypothetical protein
MSEDSKAFKEILDPDEFGRYEEMRRKWPEPGDKLMINGQVWTRHDLSMIGEHVGIPQARVTTWFRDLGRKCWLTVDLFDITFLSHSERHDIVTFRLREYGELE